MDNNFTPDYISMEQVSDYYKELYINRYGHHIDRFLYDECCEAYGYLSCIKDSIKDFEWCKELRTKIVDRMCQIIKGDMDD